MCQVAIRSTPRALHYYHNRLTVAAKGTWKRQLNVLDGTLSEYSHGVFEAGLA